MQERELREFFENRAARAELARDPPQLDQKMNCVGVMNKKESRLIRRFSKRLSLLRSKTAD
jgi:hypothetical protein